MHHWIVVNLCRRAYAPSIAPAELARIVLCKSRSIFLVRNGGSQAAAPSGAAVCFCGDENAVALLAPRAISDWPTRPWIASHLPTAWHAMCC